MKSTSNSISNSISNDCTFDPVNNSDNCNPSDVSSIISQYPYWIQMYLPETLEVPSQKPDIETINSITASIDILRSEVVKTPIPTVENLEGKMLTGRKLIIEGHLCQQIVYTADLAEQSIHSAHFLVPFSAYIVVPLQYTFTNNGINTTLDSLDIDYEVFSCIENISINVLDSRTFSKNTTFLLYAIPTQSF